MIWRFFLIRLSWFPVFELERSGQMRQLPPLNGLRTFEVAARLSSFKLAAEELFVTQSAVSQQIRALETHLGVSLFVRKVNGLELTGRGAQLLPEVAHALRILDEALLDIEGVPRAISVSTSASFATAWLISRFRLFENENPDINIYMNAAPIDGGVNALERYDIKVSYDIDPDRIAERHLILREWLLPVCSPDFRSAMGGGDPCDTPVKAGGFQESVLAIHRLLLNTPDAGDWRRWLAFHNVDRAITKVALRRAMALPTDIAAIEMAVGGYGIALANLHYIAERLADGILVPALDVSAFPLGGHFLDVDQRYMRGSTRRFKNWLEEQASASTDRISCWCGEALV
jgi:LysR family glycine cleavage system transcriptional activator